MKLTNIGLLFSIIFVSMLVIADRKTRDLSIISQKQIQYNQALDTAVQDALFQMVELDSGRAHVLNKEEVIKNFFRSLWINMGIMEQQDKKMQIALFIPILVLVEEKEFTIFYYKEDTSGIAASGIPLYESKTYNYKYDRNPHTIYFTLNDYVYVTDQKGETNEGFYQDLEFQYPLEIFRSKERFHRIRRDTIISILQTKIKYYINQHNKIAQKYNISYEFALPTIEKEEWYQTIDDCSFLAFFQGYPYGNNIMGFYNRVAIGGARLYKKKAN